MSRQCKCGGVVKQHQLTKNREAWTCVSCKKYEIVTITKDKPIKKYNG